MALLATPPPCFAQSYQYICKHIFDQFHWSNKHSSIPYPRLCCNSKMFKISIYLIYYTSKINNNKNNNIKIIIIQILIIIIIIGLITYRLFAHRISQLVAMSNQQLTTDNRFKLNQLFGQNNLFGVGFSRPATL